MNKSISVTALVLVATLSACGSSGQEGDLATSESQLTNYTDWVAHTSNSQADGRGVWSSYIAGAEPGTSGTMKFVGITIDGVAQPSYPNLGIVVTFGPVKADGTYNWGGVVDGCPVKSTCVYGWDIALDGVTKPFTYAITPIAAPTRPAPDYTQWVATTSNTLPNGRGVWVSHISGAEPGSSGTFTFVGHTIDGVPWASDPSLGTVTPFGPIKSDGTYDWGGSISGCPEKSTCGYGWNITLDGVTKPFSVVVTP